MHSMSSVKWALSLMALLAPGAASAFVAPAATKSLHAQKSASYTVGIRVLRPALKQGAVASIKGLKAANGSSVKVDAASGAMRVLSGSALAGSGLKGASAQSRDELVAVALDYVSANADVFGVDAKDLRLNEAATLIDATDQFLKFQVLRDGLRIQDAGIDFRFKRGQLIQVVNQTFAEAVVADSGARGGLDQIAADTLAAKDIKSSGEAYRVVATKSGYSLVRVARFDVAAQDGERYQVEVEAATGHIFEVRPTVFRLEGSASGQVHPRWYGEPLEFRPYGELHLAYGTNGSITTDLSGNFIDAPNDAQPRLDGFAGPRVIAVPMTGTRPAVAGAVSRDLWNVQFMKTGEDRPEVDKNVAQSMVFYHANAMIQRAKQYINTTWFDAQLVANINLNQTCNAHWDGSTINFYSADSQCANTGLISDVVYHEWGHGLDDNTGGIEDGAYSEGYGDIMSLVMTRSNILGIGFLLNGSPVRDLDPDKIYPQDAGEVHDEGQIIGSTFYDLFTYLSEQHGADQANELIANYAFKSIFTASRYTDVYDAILVIDDDNGDLSDKTPNYCYINKAFAQHGLTVVDEACNLASVDEFQIDDSAAGNGNGILEPGESANIYMMARNAGQNGIDSMTGTLRLTGADNVVVTRPTLNWGAIPARSSARSSDAAEVMIGGAVACGTKVTASVALVSGERTANVSREILLGRLEATAAMFAASGLPADIRDNETTTATVDVEGGDWTATTAVHEAHLRFDVTHTYVGDLTISLVSPDGTRKQVYEGSGSGDDIHFDEDVTNLVGGVLGMGNWSLEVTDNAGADVGTLDSFQLTVTPAHFVCD